MAKRAVLDEAQAEPEHPDRGERASELSDASEDGRVVERAQGRGREHGERWARVQSASGPLRASAIGSQMRVFQKSALPSPATRVAFSDSDLQHSTANSALCTGPLSSHCTRPGLVSRSRLPCHSL